MKHEENNNKWRIGVIIILGILIIGYISLSIFNIKNNPKTKMCESFCKETYFDKENSIYPENNIVTISDTECCCMFETSIKKENIEGYTKANICHNLDTLGG